MPQQVELQSQFSDIAVLGIIGTVSATITAAGTSGATATAISATNNTVTTATFGQGVILPAGRANGDTINITNNTTTNICIYPPSGGKLNGGTANVPLLQGAGRMNSFQCLNGTDWTVDSQ